MLIMILSNLNIGTGNGAETRRIDKEIIGHNSFRISN